MAEQLYRVRDKNGLFSPPVSEADLLDLCRAKMLLPTTTVVEGRSGMSLKASDLPFLAVEFARQGYASQKIVPTIQREGNQWRAWTTGSLISLAAICGLTVVVSRSSRPPRSAPQSRTTDTLRENLPDVPPPAPVAAIPTPDSAGGFPGIGQYSAAPQSAPVPRYYPVTVYPTPAPPAVPPALAFTAAADDAVRTDQSRDRYRQRTASAGWVSMTPPPFVPPAGWHWDNRAKRDDSGQWHLDGGYDAGGGFGGGGHWVSGHVHYEGGPTD